jgi:hypothetical protein
MGVERARAIRLGTKCLFSYWRRETMPALHAPVPRVGTSPVIFTMSLVNWVPPNDPAKTLEQWLGRWLRMLAISLGLM